MEAKPAKGRKRQGKKVAAKQEGAPDEAAPPAPVATHPPEAEATDPTEEAPKPTLSQRITRSLKQLSALGGQPRAEGGDEVDQTSREPLLAVEPPPTQESPAEGTAEHDQQQEYHHQHQHQPRRRLRFGQPSWPTTHPGTLAAAAAALLLLLLAGQLAQRQRGRQAAAQLETQTQLEALLKTTTQHAQRLQAVQQAQDQVSRTLAALSAAVQEAQAGAATAGEKVGVAVASVQERLAALEAEVGQQGSLLQQLQRLLQQQEAVAGSSRPASPPLQLGLSAEQVAGVVQAEVQRALSLFEADRTGMPDYALASAGGHIAAHSQLLQQPASGSGVVGRLASLLNPPTLHPLADQFLLSPSPQPGQCLPLAGSSSFVDIDLAQPIHPTAFSYEHIPAATAFDIRSAPRSLEVYAVASGGGSAGDSAKGSPQSGNSSAGEGPNEGGQLELLGRLVYDPHGRAVQTAALGGLPGAAAVGRVRVQVTSNHGHPEYTCLYRIRVHGTPAAAS